MNISSKLSRISTLDIKTSFCNTIVIVNLFVVLIYYEFHSCSPRAGKSRSAIRRLRQTRYKRKAMAQPSLRPQSKASKPEVPRRVATYVDQLVLLPYCCLNVDYFVPKIYRRSGLAEYIVRYAWLYNKMLPTELECRLCPSARAASKWCQCVWLIVGSIVVVLYSLVAEVLYCRGTHELRRVCRLYCVVGGGGLWWWVYSDVWCVVIYYIWENVGQSRCGS